MEERFFLRRNGVILGPLPAGQLQRMLQSGEIDAQDELSSDKASWLPVQEVLAGAFPALDLGAPEPETKPEAIAKPIAAPVATMPTPEIAESPVAVQPQPAPVPAGNPWRAISGDVIRLLWNAPDAQTQIRAYGERYSVRAGWLAVLLAVLLAAFGNALFASRYAIGTKYLWIGSYAVLTGTLLLTYLVTTGLGGDMLSAGTVTLEIAGFHVVNVALLFLPGTDWCAGQLRLAFPLFLYLLFVAAFALNAIAATCRRLTEHGIAAYPAGIAALIWNVIIFYGYIEGIVIPVMQGVMA